MEPIERRLPQCGQLTNAEFPMEDDDVGDAASDNGTDDSFANGFRTIA